MDSFELLLSAIYEDYVGKIKKYCESHKNCRECRFCNGVCRLNNYPFNWTEVSYEYTENEDTKAFTEISED